MSSQRSPYLNIVLSTASSNLSAEVAEVLAPVFSHESEALYGSVDNAHDTIFERYCDALFVATVYNDGRLVGACCLEDTSKMACWKNQGLDPGFEVAGLGVAPEARGMKAATRLVNVLVNHVGFASPILACTWAGAPSTNIFSAWTHLQAVPLQDTILNVWRHPKSGDRFNLGPLPTTSV